MSEAAEETQMNFYRSEFRLLLAVLSVGTTWFLVQVLLFPLVAGDPRFLGAEEMTLFDKAKVSVLASSALMVIGTFVNLIRLIFYFLGRSRKSGES